jgi:steroid 5-alpha reductase family enzyme
MDKILISISGILCSLLVAVVVGLAGSTGGKEIATIPVFFACGLFAFVTQWVAFLPAYLYQTEKYFDLLGSITYVTLALAALFFSSMEPGSVVIAFMVSIWAGRLGSFLFFRIKRVGHDSRFRTIKTDFLQFLMTWTLQGLWVFITFSAGLAAITSGRAHPLDGIVVVGCLIWLIGFLIEVIADNQKSEFRLKDGNAGKFIQDGLWAMSRHPNYFGEIMLWTGIAVAASPALVGMQYVTLISPLFVVLLLTKLSGVRMLEHRAKKRWGQEPDFIEYQEKTPMLVLNPFLIGTTSR